MNSFNVIATENLYGLYVIFYEYFYEKGFGQKNYRKYKISNR